MNQPSIITIDEMITRYEAVRDAVVILNDLWSSKAVKAISWSIPISVIGEEKPKQCVHLLLIPFVGLIF